MTTETRSFNVKDRLGRTIGAHVSLSNAADEKITSTGELTWSAKKALDEGKPFRLNVSATRNGHHYGASQSSQYFATEADRAKAVANYFKAAEKRAAKKEGK